MSKYHFQDEEILLSLDSDKKLDDAAKKEHYIQSETFEL